MSHDELKPRDHAEAVAVFRAQVIGPLVCRSDWTHGELADALRGLFDTAGTPVVIRVAGAKHKRQFADHAANGLASVFRVEATIRFVDR